MRQANYINYGMCIYQSIVTGKDDYQLGDIVINEENEIGVIIQMHSISEFRTDMFGNSSSLEVKMATKEQIKAYRPNLKKQAHFIHELQS